MSELTPQQEHTITIRVLGPSYGRYECTCGWHSRTSGDGEPYEHQNAQRHDVTEHTRLTGHKEQ